MADTSAIEPRILIVEGKKVNLVLPEERDARTLTGFMNNPVVTKYLLRYMPMHLEAEKQWLLNQSNQGNTVHLGIVEKGCTTLIGMVSLGSIDTRSGVSGFGLSIGDTATWGKGYGTEATTLMCNYGFYHLNLRAIELRVYASNTSARRVYEKCGFRKVGVLKEWLYLSPGVYDDEILMVVRRPK